VIEAAAEDGRRREGCDPNVLTGLAAICDLHYLIQQLRGTTSTEGAHSPLWAWAADLLGRKVQALVGHWALLKEHEAGTPDRDITEEWPIPGRREKA
jgi:hypothetical protein